MKLKEILSILIVGLFIVTACNESQDSEADADEMDDMEMSMEGMQSPGGDIEVTDADMDKMIELMKIFQPMSEAAEAKMIQAVEAEGLDVNSYTDIQRGMMSPEGADQVSAADMEKFTKATDKIEEIQMESQEEFERILSENKMTSDQYQAIFMAIQSDPELMDKFMKKMGIDTEAEQF